MPLRGPLHHLELWVPDLERATASLGWLLLELGYVPYQHWERGRSWQLGDSYVVIERSLALSSDVLDRCAPGLNHLAFHAGNVRQVDELVAAARNHGWTILFPDRHPHAGGPDHYAGYLENADGFEVELVAGT